MNPHANETEIVILGETYTLRASFKALVEIEQRAGVGIYGLMAKWYKAEITIGQVASVIYGGMKGGESLKKGDKTLSFEDVCEMCMKQGLIKLLKPAGDFLALGMQGDEPSETVEEKKV